MKFAHNIDFLTFTSHPMFHPRCRLTGETDGMIKLDGEFKTVPYDWRVGGNKWDGTNEETFLIEIAAPTTSLTTELTLFNKSKRRTCKFTAQVSRYILLSFPCSPRLNLHHFAFHVSPDTSSNLSSILINSPLFFRSFSAPVKNKIIKKPSHAMNDYSDEWRNSVNEAGT